MTKLRSADFARQLARLLALALICLASAHAAQAQAPAFNYQGRLTDGGVAANGAFDLQFILYNALMGGAQQGPIVTLEDVAVANGIFTVNLDFGAGAFPGANRWLEISVRPGVSVGAFTLLSPRQPINSTPYAVRSLSASAADSLSVACVNCVTSGQIGGVNGSAVSGAIPVASVPAGSGNYVQNTTTPQTTSNFNISGDGTAGGTLNGNIVNATAFYSIGTRRVFSVAGMFNVFAGDAAGAANTTGAFNAFFGRQAGDSNTTGSRNAFFGYIAGDANTTGNDNAFFGGQAGASNTTASNNAIFGSLAGTANTANNNAFFGAAAGDANTTGFNNALFGRSAGNTNTTGTNNTILGNAADVGVGNLSNATALGSEARVDCSNCLVLGSVGGINGASASPNVGIGTTAPATKLEVVNADSSAASVFTTSYGNTNNAIIGRQASGTLTAPDATASGLSLLFLGGRGHTGAGFATVSRVGVNLEASQVWTATANGTRITFDTTANGTTSRVERMRIDHNGNVGIGTTTINDKLVVLEDLNNSRAILGEATGNDGQGVMGRANTGASAIGIYGVSSTGRAGLFIGDVGVQGNLSKSSGAFKIDHPLDPANKYLYHSFVESPDMKNIYDGNVTTDAVGEAEVVLPDWFQALNRDFRYQLTVIGQFAQAIVAEEIKDNRFKIRTSLPQVKVSWQVTGIRQDAFAERHRIPVEVVKPEKERGSYLHPAVFDQAEEKGVEWALRPEMMREMKERREKAKQPAPPPAAQPKPGSEKP